MKRNTMFLALLSATFLFPSVGSVSNADALADISHCSSLEPTATRPACEAANRGNYATLAQIEDKLMGASGVKSAPAQSTGMSEILDSSGGGPTCHPLIGVGQR
jgi:hypothetical protein